MTHFKTLHDCLDCLDAHPDTTGLLDFRQEPVEIWSFDRLAGQVSRLAQGLSNSGIHPGDRVVVSGIAGPAWVVVALATLRAAGVVVPMDMQWPDDDLEHVLADSDPHVVFTMTRKIDRIRERLKRENIRYFLLDGDANHPQHWSQLLQNQQKMGPSVDPEDLAVLFYTSGTTGRPKGVPLTHRNLVFQINSLLSLELIRDTDRVLLPLPLHHIYPFVIGMLAPLTKGIPLIFPKALTGSMVIQAIRQGQASVLIGVPRLYRVLHAEWASQIRSRGWWVWCLFRTAHWLREQSRKRGLSSGKALLSPVRQQVGPQLRLLASGGDWLDPDLGHELEKTGWQIAIGYGLTETSPLLTLRLPGEGPLDGVGKPMQGVDMRVVPIEMEKEGEPWREIQVRGPGVFTGYHHLPDQTREVFTEDGWYRTGDLGVVDAQGYLRVTGRVSTMMVTPSGAYVQPHTVEKVYQEAPEISEVGVFQKDKRLVAVVVPDAGELHKREVADLEDAVRKAIDRQSKQLPSDQRLSDHVLVRDALARTRLGKIRRHLLPERFEQARNAGGKGMAQQVGPLPISEMSDQDRALLEQEPAYRVWQWLARQYPHVRVTPDASPERDLGIDSLEWLNVTLALRQQTGLDLDDEAIRQISTVRDLLHEVRHQKVETERASVQEALQHPEAYLDDKQLYWLSPLGKWQAGTARGGYSFIRTLMRTLFSVKVEGRQHLPSKRPLVFAPNHTSNLDAPALAAVLDNDLLRHTYWSGWTGVTFHTWVARLLSRLAQVIPIERVGDVASSLAFGAAVLKNHKNLVWFAEGALSPTGEVQRFKPGLGILLDHYPVLVVPTYILGSYEALPKHRNIPRLKPIKVIFDVPVEVDQLRREGQGDEPHARITNALQERVRKLERLYQGTSARITLTSQD